MPVVRWHGSPSTPQRDERGNDHGNREHAQNRELRRPARLLLPSQLILEHASQPCSTRRLGRARRRREAEVREDHRRTPKRNASAIDAHGSSWTTTVTAAPAQRKPARRRRRPGRRQRRARGSKQHLADRDADERRQHEASGGDEAVDGGDHSPDLPCGSGSRVTTPIDTKRRHSQIVTPECQKVIRLTYGALGESRLTRNIISRLSASRRARARE